MEMNYSSVITSLLVIGLLWVYTVGAQDQTIRTSLDEPPSGVQDAVSSGSQSQGRISSPGPIQHPQATANVGEGATYSTDGNGRLELSQVSSLTPSALPNSQIGKSKGVTLTNDKVYIQESQSFSSGTATSENAKGVEFTSSGFKAAQAASYQDRSSAYTGAANVVKAGQETTIQSFDSITTPSYSGESWTSFQLHPDDSIGAQSGKILNFLGTQIEDFTVLQANPSSQIVSIRSAAKLKANTFELGNLKNITVKVGAKISVETPEPLDIMVGTKTLHLTPINSTAKIIGSAEPQVDPTIQVERANITYDTGSANETIQIPNSALITTSYEFGLFCFDLEPPATYIYDTGDYRESFALAPKTHHTICVKRSFQQKPKDCAQCTVLDLTANKINSTGSLYYQRSLFKDDLLQNDFVDYVSPATPSQYQVVWSDLTSYGLNFLRSDNITTKVSAKLSIRDELKEGIIHRILVFTDTDSSKPILKTLKSGFPTCEVNDSFIQPTIHNTMIVVE